MTWNIYAIIILAAMLANFAIGWLTDQLNLRHGSDTPPEEFANLIDAEKHEKSRNYLKATTGFGHLSGTFSLLLTLGFWLFGGFHWLDSWIRQSCTGNIPRGLLFFAILIFGSRLLNIPFSLYSTFVIEERFGFNRTTRRTFATDFVKSTILSIVIGGPILAAILAFFEFAGDSAWLWCWLATVAFSFCAQILWPVLIMPWFNKFEPLPEGELRGQILACAQRAHFPVKQLFVMDGSRRSGHSNAFVTGFGPFRRIALYDTLIEEQTTEEIVAITAHEIGHWKRGHMPKMLVIGIIQTAVLFRLLALFLTHKGLFAAFGVSPSTYAGLVFFGMLYAPLDLLLSLAFNALSRKHEYEADRFSAELVGGANPLISALKKLAVNNLSNLTPHPLTVFLEYSHPPILERIHALRTCTPTKEVSE